MEASSGTTSVDPTSTDPSNPGGAPSEANADPTAPSDPAPEPTLEEQQAAAAAAQSPAEPQVVPEQRPQSFVQPDPSQQSATSQRVEAQGPIGQEGIDRANSDEAKEAAAKVSRTPNLLVGQRVTIVDGPDSGRMGYVLGIQYVDEVNALIAGSAIPERSFAEIEEYIIRTRDGRTDTLSLKPDQIKPLEVNEGWGRGQF